MIGRGASEQPSLLDPSFDASGVAEALEDQCGGQLSFVLRGLHGGPEFSRQPERVVGTASVYKLFVLLHVACSVEEGRLGWSDPLTLSADLCSFGSGVLSGLTPGLTLTLHDACFLMTAVSDNTAANLLLTKVGIAAVNERLARLGFQRSAVLPQASPASGAAANGAVRPPIASGQTTPRETADLLTSLGRGTLGFPAATREMLALMSTQQDRSMAARALPAGWYYAGKTGADPQLRADAGLIAAPDGRGVVAALFCRDLPEPDWSVDNPGTRALATLTRRALQLP